MSEEGLRDKINEEGPCGHEHLLDFRCFGWQIDEHGAGILLWMSKSSVVLRGDALSVFVNPGFRCVGDAIQRRRSVRSHAGVRRVRVCEFSGAAESCSLARMDLAFELN